jgi:hypothetical protein
MEKKTATSSTHAIADVSSARLAQRVEQITRHLDAIDKLMSDGVQLSDVERKVALRLQSGEVEALNGVLDFAAARTELFADLADEDDGKDPSTFETELLRERLSNAQTLAAVTARIGKTASTFSDSTLYVTTLAKRPALAAYEIAKPFQTRDRQHGPLLNAAVNLYGARARAGAKKRAADKAQANGGTVVK